VQVGRKVLPAGRLGQFVGAPQWHQLAGFVLAQKYQDYRQQGGQKQCCQHLMAVRKQDLPLSNDDRSQQNYCHNEGGNGAREKGKANQGYGVQPIAERPESEPESDQHQGRQHNKNHPVDLAGQRRFGDRLKHGVGPCWHIH
jgi:hypothetical protein